jgi:hypothetical protein
LPHRLQPYCEVDVAGGGVGEADGGGDGEVDGGGDGETDGGGAGEVGESAGGDGAMNGRVSLGVQVAAPCALWVHVVPEPQQRPRLPNAVDSQTVLPLAQH